MPDLLSINAAFRSQLLAGDADLRAQIVDAYQTVYQALKDELAQVLADVEADPESVAYRVARLRKLEEQITEALSEWGGETAGAIAKQQRTAAELAQGAQTTLLTAAMAPAPAGIQISSVFTTVPTRAIEALVGFASDGSPLATLFAEIAPEAAEAARNALLAGLAFGHGPDQVAKVFADELGVPLTRALRIARTETMRAYRESSRMFMQAQGDLVKGWYWMAAKDLRTCPVCWAMDGTLHPTEEAFASHVNCRCTTVPAAASWADLGYRGMPDRTWKPDKTGVQAFAQLDESAQRLILGPGKFELYQSGEIQLSDLVEEGEDQRWGPYRAEKSLKALA